MLTGYQSPTKLGSCWTCCGAESDDDLMISLELRRSIV
jgi:hypothetical protein